MSWLKSPHPGNRPQVFAVVLLAIVLAGCATLKQCAYEGFDRDQWQQPERVIQSLQIRPGAVVADLGSGSGYFALRLAKAVGTTGKVYAVDIDSAINKALKERAKKEHVGNIDVLLAKPNDPRLPEPVDLIFTSNTYHHIDDRISYFAGLREYLRPSGKIAVIDYDRRAWLEGLLRHYTPKEFIKREMEQAGYKLQNDFDFLERQSFLVFVPRSDPSQSGALAPAGGTSK
ncbi:MAG: methyltransferase domain-containing protein [Deltaproteobacteria bacterium]|nr:methyltransferase domain-containing protein [Deltaproteobacteria bacterium]